jgi:preprotein translocase subunit SecE
VLSQTHEFWQTYDIVAVVLIVVVVVAWLLDGILD